MPPMPPPPGMPGPSFLGCSVIVASVVIDQPGDRGRVLQGGAHDLGRIDDAKLDEIAIFAGLRVIAVVVVAAFEQLADHHRAIRAGVLDDLARRGLDRLADDVDAGLLIGVLDLHRVEGLDGAQQGDAAARRDAFLDGRAGRVERVVDAILASPSPRLRSRRRRGSPRRRRRAWQDAPAASRDHSRRWCPQSAP